MAEQVRIEAVADDGFGHPCFRIVERDGTPTYVGLFVSTESALKFVATRRWWTLMPGSRPQLSLV